MSNNRGVCSHVIGASLTHAAGAMASVATIAISAVFITKCATMIHDTLYPTDNDNELDNGEFLSQYSFQNKKEKEIKKNKIRNRGWYLITGSYTMPRQADPFIGVNGDSSGVPYDESKLGRGLSAMWMDAVTGKMEVVDVNGGDVHENNGQNINPSYLVVHPNGKILYACNEVQSFEGQDGTGGVSAFEINEEKGGLSFKFIGSSISHGGSPCMIAIDRTATVLLVANYMGGNIAMIPLGSNGVPRRYTAICHQHFGEGLDTKGRQEAPHAHSVVLDASQSTLLVCDLGTDQIFPYAIDASAFSLFPATGTLTLTSDLLTSSKLAIQSSSSSSSTRNSKQSFETMNNNDENENENDIKKYYDHKVRKGFGPRHCVIHPNGKTCYIICEMSSQLLCFEYFASSSLSSSLSSTLTPSMLMPTMNTSSLRDSIQSPVLHTMQNPNPSSDPNPSGNSSEVVENLTSTPSGGSGGLGFWSFVSLAQGLRANNDDNNDKKQDSVNGDDDTECASEIMKNSMKKIDEETLESSSSSSSASSVVLVQEPSDDPSSSSSSLMSSNTSKDKARKINLNNSDLTSSSNVIGSNASDGSGSFGKLLGCYNLLSEEFEESNSKERSEYYKFNEGRWAADVLISPSGKFLYATNRLHDSIVTFSVPPSCEAPLKKLGYIHCGGKTPRNFTMSPDGRFLLVAHQHSHTMSSFAVDQNSGALTLVNTIDAPNVACVKFI